MRLDAGQTKYAKYGSIKTANFTTTQLNHGCKDMIQKYTQHIMKGNLFLQKYLQQPERTKPKNK